MADRESATPTASSTLPRSAKRCRIPRLARSNSARAKPGEPREPPTGRPKSMTIGGAYDWLSMHSIPLEDDQSSVRSYGSYASYASYASQSQCGTEASVPGGSRPVSRSHYGKRYVLHCDRHISQPEHYLTPTQRKEKEIRQLKALLAKQTQQCDEKDAQLGALRDEMTALRDALAELQLGKHSLMNSSQGSNTSGDSMSGKNNNNSSVISFESNSSSDDMPTVTNNDDSGISTSISPRNSSEEFDDIAAEKVDKCVCTDEVLDYSKPKTEVNILKTEVSGYSKTEVNHPKTEVGFPKTEVSYPKTELSVIYHLKSKPEVKYAKPEVSVTYSKPKSEVNADFLKSKTDFSNAVVNDGVSREKASVPLTVAPGEFDRFLAGYKQELEQLKSQQREQYQDLKDRFNDRVDELLQKLTEANIRYLELRPMFDRTQDKIHSIESQLSGVQKDMETHEDYHSQMYRKMHRKGHDVAARYDPETEDASSVDLAHPRPLQKQLQQLENELEQTRRLYREAKTRGSGDRQAEYTLRFLKDAVFYFLTKKDREHLKAIQSILGFTEAERMAVAKATKHRRLL